MQDNGPFALAQAIVAGRKQTVYRHIPDTLPGVYRKALRAKRTPFLIAEGGGLSLESLFDRSTTYAGLFIERGIGRGMRVALDLPDDGDWIAAFIALTSLGATAVLTHGANFASQIAGAGCIAAVTQDDPGLPICVGPKALSAARHIRSVLPAVEIDPEQEACIAFTSGSTGDPKGAVLTHRGITTGLANMMLAGTLAARGASVPMTKPVAPAVLLRTPLSHVSGYMQVLLMLMVSGRVVRSSDTDICRLIAEHQLTSITGISDGEIGMLLASRDSIQPLRSIAAAGRSLPRRARLALRKTLPHLGLGSGYGLTETNGLVCAVGNHELDMRPHAVGRVLPTAQCRILDRNGMDCAANESGEIWLRGAMLMQGYCNRPGHAMPDGWFATGDIGYLSPDGMLNVLDKEDRFLRSGGERISCRDIEEAAREAAGILDIAALPMTKPGGGDRLLIVAAPAIADFSSLKIALALQFPAQLIHQAAFVVAEKLPRTASGKIAYARLLEDAAPR